jgi:hypothetical protein
MHLLILFSFIVGCSPLDYIYIIPQSYAFVNV